MRYRLIIIWIILLTRPTFAADQFGSVREFIRARIAESQVPSISVAVARDGKIIWEEGFGWADRENRVPANEHTMYSLASITKPFTATALMTLVEKKRIDLDRPLNEYLGDVKIRARVGDADDATVRRVASHTSGLPAHYQFFFKDESLRPPSMDETIHRFGNLVTIPGEKWEYSNLGYGILGHVISRVSGQSYEDYMRQSVFVKLGLTHTSVGIGPGLEKFAAVRYAFGVPWPYDSDTPGAGDIYSSAHDLIRFAMFHLKAHLPDQMAILSDAAIDEMQKPIAVVNPAEGLGYGIGWFINDNLSGYHTVIHPGGMLGASTWLQFVPSERIAVAVLCNTGDDWVPSEVAAKILATLLPKYRVPAPANSPLQPAPFQPSAALVGTWTGTLSTYKAGIPVVLDVLASGEVHVQIDYQLKILHNVTWENDTLSGRMLDDIGIEEESTPSERSGPDLLTLNLKLRGNILNGPAYVQRTRMELAQWLELKKN